MMVGAGEDMLMYTGSEPRTRMEFYMREKRAEAYAVAFCASLLQSLNIYSDANPR